MGSLGFLPNISSNGEYLVSHAWYNYMRKLTMVRISFSPSFEMFRVSQACSEEVY